MELMGYPRYIIGVVSSRKVIKEYFEEMNNENEKFQEKYGGVPFEYLQDLFSAVEKSYVTKPREGNHAKHCAISAAR